MSPVQFELKHSMIFLTLIFSFAPSPGPFLFVVIVSIYQMRCEGQRISQGSNETDLSFSTVMTWSIQENNIASIIHLIIKYLILPSRLLFYGKKKKIVQKSFSRRQEKKSFLLKIYQLTIHSLETSQFLTLGFQFVAFLI